MTMTVTLKLSDVTYRRARRLAEVQTQALADVLADWITATLPAAETHAEQVEDRIQKTWSIAEMQA